MTQVIDLRKYGNDAESSQNETVGPDFLDRRPAFQNSPVEWSAYDNTVPAGPRKIFWTGTAAVLLAIFGILTRSYFFAAFILISFAAVLVYFKRSPKEFSFAITKEGVRVGSRMWLFSEIKSFWIFENDDGNELSLEIVKTAQPYLRIPLGELAPDSIRGMLSGFLPEEEHKILATDQIAKKLGL